MSENKDSDSSTSESEVSACSSSFNPMKALYSKKSQPPVGNAPMYENLGQYESSLKNQNIIPVGEKERILHREREKERKRLEEQQALEEKNRKRFSRFQLPVPEKRVWVAKNVLTRMERMEGPLGVLKDCIDHRLRVMVMTRNDSGIRGVLHATLVAFDKHWNLALSDVLEIWKRKGVKKRKIPPGLGVPVAKGTAASISPVATVTETPLGKGVWECTRHLPQLFIRGEHVVLVRVTER